MFMSALQSGSAVAVGVLALVVLGGGYSIVKYLKTAGGLDRGALSAEAQAIDMQIELANINYSSLPFAAAHTQTLKPPKTTPLAGTGSATSTPPAEISTPSMTLDDALNVLSQ